MKNNKTKFIFLFSICLSVFILISKGYSAESMSYEEADRLVKQASLLCKQHQYQEAIPIYEKVAQAYPNFSALYRDIDTGVTLPISLGFAYYDNKDYEKALPIFEKHELKALKKDQEEPSIVLTFAENCRKSLSEQGKLNAPLAVDSPWWIISDGVQVIDGTVMMPAEIISGMLRCTVREDNPRGDITITRFWEKSKKLSFYPEQMKFRIENGIEKPIVLKGKGKQMLVPVQVIAEYFGCKVQMDKKLNILWLK